MQMTSTKNICPVRKFELDCFCWLLLAALEILVQLMYVFSFAALIAVTVMDSSIGVIHCGANTF
jgi:hypothetical protein